MAVAYVKALESHGVVATPKHYAANVGDGGRDSNAVHFSERLLREIYLPAFKACFQEGGARSVMPSYNSIDGLPFSCHSWLLDELLRGEWGFDGIVVSDYGGIWGIAAAHHIAKDYPEASKLALEAGMDVDLPCGGTELFGLLQRGELSEAFIDPAVTRVLKLKFQLGLFDDPYVDAAAADAVVQCPEHVALALQAGRESITLLKNEGRVLPLAPDIKRLGIFGPTKDVLSLGDYSGPYGGIWGGPGVTPLQGIRAIVSPQTEVLVHEDGDPAAFARGCDAAIIFTAIEESEGSDRSYLGLPRGQQDDADATSHRHAIIVDASRREVVMDGQVELIQAVAATGVPTIVVLLSGSAITMSEWIDQVAGIVEAWYPGEQGGTALAEVLFGAYNPAGRLPITFPKAVGQVPLYYNHKPTGRGYAYNDNDGKPLFPFGHGLSYTTFVYENLRIEPAAPRGSEPVQVRVDVTNSGERAGDEVVQLYLHDELASLSRPVKELKGFTRIALAAGERQTVTFTLTAEHLGMWNRAMQFVVEPGTFRVMVGASSEDIRLDGTFDVLP